MILGKKGEQLEPGYVFAPYVMATTESSDFFCRNLRKSKISKIFNLDYHSGLFTPSKSISSRYSTKIVNSSMYGVIGATNV
jgi:hypothetical protein